MTLTLYSLLEASLLCVNAIAILNRQRFLSKGGMISSSDQLFPVGLTPSSQPTYSAYGDDESRNSVKGQIVNLIAAVQTVMRGERCVPHYEFYSAAHLSQRRRDHHQTAAGLIDR